VFENTLLRRIFGPKRDEKTGGWRKLHNEELGNLYSSASIIRIIKRRTLRWTGHAERMSRRGICIYICSSEVLCASVLLKCFVRMF
jgi:hypothetical protein